ncbi:MAG TPA: oligosaccharide flippase family protein [Candidatus Saccharimonadales bacterium]|nr:oligosaccharide flippase family protein [Candidatus Saccharimonadales bacterium]
MSRRALIANGLWVTSKYVVLSASGLVLSLGFAHLSTKEVFGQYQFVLSLLAILSIFSLPGLNMAALKAIAKNDRRAVLEAITRSFKSSLLAIPILLGYATYLLLHRQTSLGLTVAMAGLLFPFFYAPNTWYVFYEGRLIFRPVAIRTVAASLLVTAAVLAALFFKLNLFWLVFTYLFLSAAFTGYFYWEIRRVIKAAPPSKGEKGLDVRYGLHVSAQKFALTLSESLPALAVGFFLGHQAIASFQVANLFLGATAGFIGALAALTLPRLFADSSATHHQVFWQNLVIGFLAAAGYWLLVRLAFLRLYGNAYHESYLLALALVPLPLVVSVRTFLVNYFTAQAKNALIVTVYAVANGTAFLLFGLTAHHLKFTVAAGLYLYALNLLLAIPLFIHYLFGLKKRRILNPDQAKVVKAGRRRLRIAFFPGSASVKTNSKR